RPKRGRTKRLKRRAAKATAAADFQSSHRNESAKRPKPAWIALRLHSPAVIVTTASRFRPRPSRHVLEKRLAEVPDRAVGQGLVFRGVEDRIGRARRRPRDRRRRRRDDTDVPVSREGQDLPGELEPRDLAP